MKIFGIFRGFPGLGRVVAGSGLLKTLAERGHKVKAYSYLQGNDLLASYNFDRIISEQPPSQHVMIIGLNPISKEAGLLIETIVRENPDAVLIDGEPLLTSTLAMVFPREKIFCLLNPSDVENKSLPISSLKFYRSHYLSAGHAFVHGITPKNYSELADEYSCRLHGVPTILRPSVLNLSPLKRGSFLVGILGGGSKMASQNFLRSTVKIAQDIFSLAKLLSTEKFILYCNDKEIFETLKDSAPCNLELVSEYVAPEIIYPKAKAILCRAGRNTVSEALFLKIPTVLFSTQGDFRSAEQNKNIERACGLSKGFMQKCFIGEPPAAIARKLHDAMKNSNADTKFVAGNDIVLDYIENLLQD